MFDPFKKLKLAGAFLGVAVDEAAVVGPDSLDISELFGRLSLKDLRGMSLPADRLLTQPGVRELFETRYLPEPEPLDRLAALGEGTLGFEYARYLRQNKLAQPTPSRRLNFDDPAVYLAERVRLTHPLLHLITEYDATPLGELALQAYYIGQTGNLISGVIISSALLQITRDTPDQLGAALEVTSEAFQRGKVARSFLGVAWEELWSAQVPQLRELIEIPARSSAVALLRLAAPAATPEPRPGRTGSFSAFSDAEDGFAALGRASSSSISGANSSSSASSSSTASSSPPPRPRNFTGFGGAPLKPDPDPPTQRKPAAPARPEPSRREPSAPEQRPRQSSSSSLLASFMALSEQAAKPEPPPPAPVRPPPVKPPQPPPPRIEARAPVKPPPPAPPPAPAKPGELGYKIEEAAKNITPALSPDDPDYF